MRDELERAVLASLIGIRVRAEEGEPLEQDVVDLVALAQAVAFLEQVDAIEELDDE